MSVAKSGPCRMAYSRGANAAARGQGEENNPYKNESYDAPRWRAWQEGWLWYRVSMGLEKKRKLKSGGDHG